MKKCIVVLCGFPGSGKTTAASLLQRQGLPVLRMGDLTSDMLKMKGVLSKEEDEAKVRSSLRESQGADVYARYLKPKIKKLFEKIDLVVVEGMRSVTEFESLKELGAYILLVYLELPDQLRFRRLENRTNRPLVRDELIKRDKWERQVGTQYLKKYAQLTIVNDTSKNQLEKKLLKIFKLIK